MSIQMNRVIRALLLTAATLGAPVVAPIVALAAPGHNHGDTSTPAVAAGALPRFSVSSETFELVGVLQNRHLTLYLDRAADNSPVKDAQLQLELGGIKVEVKPHGEGEFQGTLGQALKPGFVPVTATVSTGVESDLLAGELNLHDVTVELAARVHSWKTYAAWIAAAVVSFGLLSWAGRRLMRKRTAETRGER
jgi:hypothetical protein